ncbi:tripartite tricarboxylate transporter substrate binding protein [Cupriavidus oxalaticus]|uniref:Tripartite tricarboxylate transporter substrate binding protein n=1 Tax=Cupriavidus oxalaticus TaxID=96344 RepID=A0A5P3VR94_9BURK|nr:tripartite tricarboxylate transporter substrate binding protein [Cupriavidus oxalaticus]QEZ48894.1 tripartite tricarboxylate transporter substrate binding protein [Cupriavidus oxalaticus]
MIRKTLRVAFGLAFASLLAGTPVAAETYPAKPIRLVVPYPPGGFNDTLGRVVASKLSAAWGQPVIVDNKPGAGTIIGTSFVAKAAADGYTLLVVQFPFAANPWLYKSLPYDTSKDFAPIILAGQSPMTLVVSRGSSIRSVQDLVRAAKAAPGSINYGSSGSGSSNHLAMALFERTAGISLSQVPYKGSTPMLTDLGGGQVEVAFDALPHVLPLVRAGKIRAIAVADHHRAASAPELPTVSEAGVPGYEVSSWHGFVAPAGTPPAIVSRLNAEINKILKMEDVRKTFQEQGVAPAGGSATDFTAFIGKELGRWQKVVQDARILPQ